MDLAIDPGTRALGWVLGDTCIRHCGLVRAKNLEDMLETLCSRFDRHSVSRLVIERPQIYAMGHAKADPNDLAQVLIVVGCIVGLVRHEHLYLPFPKEYKGTVPKELHNARTLARMSASEREILARVDAPASLENNILDAIGLWQWSARRHGR